MFPFAPAPSALKRGCEHPGTHVASLFDETDIISRRQVLVVCLLPCVDSDLPIRFQSKRISCQFLDDRFIRKVDGLFVANAFPCEGECIAFSAPSLISKCFHVDGSSFSLRKNRDALYFPLLPRNGLHPSTFKRGCCFICRARAEKEGGKDCRKDGEMSFDHRCGMVGGDSFVLQERRRSTELFLFILKIAVFSDFIF